MIDDLSAGFRALLGHEVILDGARLHVPGPPKIRLSAILGNRRIRALMAPHLIPGAVVVDVGANIGVNTVHAALRVGPGGRVVAVEPAADNVAVLEANVRRNGLGNVEVVPAAAGRAVEVRPFFLRGAVSAVNSFYQESVYAAVTDLVRVPVVPIDDLVDGEADLVKIDVEGAELDVLEGMTRLLRAPRLAVIAEWHPLLQEMAGHAPDALPLALMNQGFRLTGASHTWTAPLGRGDLPALLGKLRRSRRPIELLAVR